MSCVISYLLLSVTSRYVIGSNKNGPLVSIPLCEFIHSLGSRTASPGGGSASAAVAAIVRNQNE